MRYCASDFNYVLHLRHYNLFSMSLWFAVSLAIEIRAIRRQYRSDGCACRFARNAHCAGMSIIGTSVFRSNDYPSQTTHSEHVFALTPTTCGQSRQQPEGWDGLIVYHWFCAALSINWLMISTYTKCTSSHHLHQEALYINIFDLFK